MTAPSFQIEELRALADAACDAALSDGDAARLEELLHGNPDAQRFYLAHVRLDGCLRWEFGNQVEGISDLEMSKSTAMDAADAPFDIAPLSSIPSSLSPSFVGGPVFSYMVASVVLCVMLLGAWAYKTSHDYRDFAQDNGRGSATSGSLERQQLVFVGRVTGMKDCRWSDPNTRTYIGASAPLGREYALTSGLMEIAYSSGARVILEGPCSYKIESSAGGFLAIGKLTAKISGQRSGFSPLAPLPPPLFSVRTPTAVVTDLGTEFGVEVAENGDTVSHVFEGKVVVRAGVRGFGDSGIRGSEKHPATAAARDYERQLAAGESVRVSRVRAGTHQDSTATETPCFTHPATPPKFVRRMPKWTPIEVFSTGVGLEEGEPDPHWQIVVRGDEPDFQPRQAVVTSVIWRFRQNDPAEAQWISLGGDLPNLTEHATYTFRTTFELKNVSEEELKTAALRGGFMADNHVTSIRLNGKAVSVPEHGYLAPFNHYYRFAVAEGFVEGVNTLEIDVLNEAPGERTSPVSPMALRVKLDGYISRGESVGDLSVDAEKGKH
ncbi:MAG: hypothetical protein JW959_09535 [Pirellulales bacterium]|nr:hypothetical protein [Pirellulales bacterium]